MPEQSEHSESILIASQEVKNLQSQKDSPAELQRRAKEIGRTADTGARDLRITRVNSDEAKQYLDSSVPKVTGYLKEIAANGRELITNKSEQYETIDGLHGSLKNQLNAQKESIGFFAQIEAADKSYETLKAALSTKNVDDSLTKLQNLQQAMPPAIGATAEYRGRVDTKISDSIKMITDFLPGRVTVLGFAKGVNAMDKLVASYEKNPTPENLANVKQQQILLDPQKLSDEIFQNKAGGGASDLYQQLWNEDFRTAKAALEGLNSRVDAKEGEGLTANADNMVNDLLANEKAIITPKYEQYSQLALRTNIDDKGERDQFLQSEEALLNSYIVLKSTVGTFSNPQTLGKLKFETQQKVQDKAKDIDAKIRQIEVNRETRNSRESLSKTNISSYVDFLGKEENGKIYKFNAAYDALSPEKKEDVRMAVEALVARDHDAVQSDTYLATLKLAKASGNFDQMQEKLGEKSKTYFEGLKLMMQGKFPESLASFQAYVQLSASFSADEKIAQKSAIDDANSRIEIMGKSADYSEGLRLLKANDNDGAEKMLRQYLAQTESMPEDAKKIHAEQMQNAHEVIKLFNNQKITQLQDLLSDVQTWKQFQIKDQIDKTRVKHDVEVAGPEVLLIEQNIGDLRARVAKGEMLDFKTEMQNIKTKVTEYNQKNAFKPEDNVIDKLSSLYEKFNSADPQQKKQAQIDFATELRDYRSYGLARKYLDKALQGDYKAAAPNVSKEKILQGMLDDPKMMANVREQAHRYYEQFKKENPGADANFSQERAEQLVINRTLNTQYSRELRKDMTDRGMAGSNNALALYNDWSPQVTREHFWQAGSFDAETYDQFKDEAKEAVAMTLATLPVGMAAGAVGKGVGALIFRGVAGKLLSEGVMEATLTAVERGGIMAIQPGSAAFSALEPAVQQMIIANSSRLALAGAASFAGGVALEGATLFMGNNLAQGLVTGQAGEIDGEHIFESIVKAAIFRGIGAGGTKMFGNAMKAGGAKGAAAFAGMEAFSGVSGMTVEAAGLYLGGHGKEVDTSFVLKTLLQNAMASAGTHLAHGVIELPSRAEGPGRAGERMQEAEQAGRTEKISKKIGVDMANQGEVPFPLVTKKVTEQGEVPFPLVTKKGVPLEAEHTMQVESRELIENPSQEGQRAPQSEELDKTIPASEVISPPLSSKEIIVANESRRAQEVQSPDLTQILEPPQSEGPPSEIAQKNKALEEGVIASIEMKSIANQAKLEFAKQNVSREIVADTAKDYHEFEETLAKHDEKALASNKKFEEALAKGDQAAIQEIKNQNPQWGRAFEHIENQAKIAESQNVVGVLKISDGIQTELGRSTPEAMQDYLAHLSQEAKTPAQFDLLDQAMIHAFNRGLDENIIFSAIENGKLIPGPKLVDSFIGEFGSRIIDNPKIPLSPEQQGRIAEKMLTPGNKDFDVDRCKKYMEEGRIDPSSPAVVDSLMKTPEGKSLMEGLIAEGKAPLTRSALDGILNDDGESALETVENGLRSGQMKLEAGMKIEEALDKIRIKKDMFADLGLLRSFRDPSNPQRFQDFKREMNETVGKLKNNEPVSGEIADILHHLKERDPGAYNLALNSDVNRLVGTECFDALINGNKIEFKNDRGETVTAYNGKFIAKGGMGSVDHVVYVVPGGDKFEFGVIKRSRPNEADQETGKVINYKKHFINEGKGAMEVTDWNHPNIIKVMHVSEDFIIYETGENAMDLREALGTASVQDYFGMLSDVADGLIEYQNHGKFQGDLKEANNVHALYAGDTVSKTKIIDNTPVDNSRTLKNYDWPHTPGYSFDNNEYLAMYKNVHQKGMSEKEMGDWMGRAMDARTFGKMLEGHEGAIVNKNGEVVGHEHQKGAFDSYIPDWKNSPKLDAIVKKLTNPLTAGEPGLIQEAQAIMKDLQINGIAAAPISVRIKVSGEAVSESARTGVDVGKQPRSVATRRDRPQPQP